MGTRVRLAHSPQLSSPSARDSRIALTLNEAGSAHCRPRLEGKATRRYWSTNSPTIIAREWGAGSRMLFQVCSAIVQPSRS
jgi:hypothetical protein